MKFLRGDLEQNNSPTVFIQGELDVLEDITVPSERYTDLRDIYVEGTGYYNSDTTEFIVGLDLKGTVTVPCAISLKPVDVDVHTKLSEVFVFEMSEDIEDDETVVLIDGDELDLYPYIWSAIVVAIPLKVVDPDLTEYPKGEGWEVLTETDYQKQKSEEIDPRLAKLKEFNFEK